MSYSINKIFIFFCLSFITGVFINNITGNATTSFIVLLFIIVLFFNLYLFSKKTYSYLIVIIIGSFLGIIISYLNIINLNAKTSFLNKFTNNNYQIIQFEITKIYNIKEFESQYIAKILKINSENVNKNIYSIITIPNNYKIVIGNIIETNTKLFIINNFNDFNYREYLFSKNIFINSYIYSLKIIEKKEINLIGKIISKIKNLLNNNIKNIYTKEEGAFLAGILIGTKENITSDLEKDFNYSGLTHLIAVSGFNISILIIFLTYIFKYFPVYIKNIIVTITIIFFTLIVGDGASVLRASIMGILGYYIINSGRKGDVLSLLIFTCFGMTIYSPYSINYDISFQLSFLAVIGIIYTKNFFEKIFNFLANFLEIKNAFILTLSALSFSLPIIFLNFGQMSIISPLANIMVSFCIPIIMIFGFLSILVYYVSNTLGLFIGYFAWIFLKYCILMIHFFGKQDWAMIKYDFGNEKNIINLLYFIILIFLIIYFRKNKRLV